MQRAPRTPATESTPSLAAGPPRRPARGDPPPWQPQRIRSPHTPRAGADGVPVGWTFAGEPPSLGSPGGTVTLVEGSSFCVCGRTGDISPDEPHGLFFRDTRLLSTWRLLVDGAPPEPLATDGGRAVRHHLRRRGPSHARGAPTPTCWCSGTATSATGCARTSPCATSARNPSSARSPSPSLPTSRTCSRSRRAGSSGGGTTASAAERTGCGSAGPARTTYAGVRVHADGWLADADGWLSVRSSSRPARRVAHLRAGAAVARRGRSARHLPLERPTEAPCRPSGCSSGARASPGAHARTPGSGWRSTRARRTSAPCASSTPRTPTRWPSPPGRRGSWRCSAATRC